MQYPLQFRGEAVEPAPFYIWGIVNTTPDSFYDGGCYEKADRAAAHARQLWEQGLVFWILAERLQDRVHNKM